MSACEQKSFLQEVDHKQAVLYSDLPLAPLMDRLSGTLLIQSQQAYYGRFLAALLLTLFVGLLTAADPWVGIPVCGLILVMILTFTHPVIALFTALASGLLFNINIMNDSPFRVLSERYPLSLIPVSLMLLVTLPHLATDKSSRKFRQLDFLHGLPILFGL